jgi:double zinc ribbon protein
MNRFSEELRIIPRVAWAFAAAVWVCMFFLLFYVILPRDAKLRLWPGAGQLAFSIWPGLLLAALVLLVGYINADARRRNMRYVMWTLLALLLPNSIGIILYFVLRDPIPAPCPKCGAPARPGFAYCPQCGADLARSCPSCKRNVEREWKSCAFCGTSLMPGSAGTPPPLGTNPLSS